MRTIVNTVDLDYFGAAGVQIIQGRDFTEADRAGAVPVAIINDTMSKRSWPNQNPLGKRFRFAGDAVFREIVGVVKTANYTSLGEEPQACIFLPFRQNFSDSMVLYVRTHREPALVLTAVQREMRSVAPQLDVSDIRTGRKIIDQALYGARMGVGLLSIVGLLALALACVGLYGVVAWLVNNRQREIGVRIALGATQGAVLRLVLGQGMKLVAVGIGVGLMASTLVGRALCDFPVRPQSHGPAQHRRSGVRARGCRAGGLLFASASGEPAGSTRGPARSVSADCTRIFKTATSSTG